MPLHADLIKDTAANNCYRHTVCVCLQSNPTIDDLVTSAAAVAHLDGCSGERFAVVIGCHSRFDKRIWPSLKLRSVGNHG